MTDPTEPPLDDLCERLKSSAEAFRKHTVYDSDGDPIRLIVQADEMDSAAARIQSDAATIANLTDALHIQNKQAEEMAEENARLRYQMEKIAVISNPDWTERRKSISTALDDIHAVAVDSVYGQALAAMETKG